MLPELRVRWYVLRRAVLGIWRCPAGGRKGPGLKGVLYSTEPFLIYLWEQAWEPLLGFLPFPIRNLKPRARSGFDRGRDDHINRNPVNQPPLDQLHPLDRLGTRIMVWSP